MSVNKENNSISEDKKGPAGKCCICDKPTDLYCPYCDKTWGESDPTYYCEEHYNSVVRTGNCCNANEKEYVAQKDCYYDW